MGESCILEGRINIAEILTKEGVRDRVSLSLLSFLR